MKRILCVLLVVVMCLTAAPLGSFAEMNFAVKASALDATGKCGESATYTFDSATGELVIEGTGAIYEKAFYQNDEIISVFISDGITNIGSYAFNLCNNLTYIDIGDTITSIGTGAFGNCYNVADINIGNSVTIIGKYAFTDCDKVTNIHLPDSLIIIEESAFATSNALASITIPDNVTTIAQNAFLYCNNLTSVTLGKRVTEIGRYAFAYCDNLTSVNLNNNLISIGGYAFTSCDKLESIDIYNSVKEIGERAFSYCTNLQDVYFIGSEAEWNEIVMGDNCFGDVTIHFKHYHDSTHVDYESGNCITTGHIEHYKCPCGKFFKDADCNYELAWEEIELPLDPTNHKGYKEVSVKIPSTCTTKGSVKMECACGDPKTVEFDIDPTAHEFDGDRCTLCGAYSGCNHGNVEFFPEIQPTCEANGYIAHYICHDCQNTVIPIEDGSYKIYNKDYTLYAEGHKLVTDEGYQPTCTSVGKTYSEYCQNCFYSIGGDEIPMLRHDYSNGKCKSCGNLCEHLNAHFNQGKPALCEDMGHKDFYYCFDCGEYLLDNNGLVIATKDEINIPATGHSFKDYIFAEDSATCYKEGIKVAKCENGCGTTDTVIAYGSKRPHVMKRYKIEHEPTCVSNGLEIWHCVNYKECGYYELVSLDLLGHELPEEFTVTEKPTCNKNGLQIKECARCKKIIETQPTPATGHDYEEKIVEPTCEKEGRHYYKCTACGDYYSDEIPELDHEYVEFYQAPTCTEYGYDKISCIRCGDLEFFDEIEPIEHDYEVFTEYPTCTESGYTEYSCTVCGYYHTEDLPPTGHDFWITDSKKETCTERGYCNWRCSECNYNYTETFSATGHSFPEKWNTILTPNCQEKGVAIRICFGCHDVETKTLPKTGHADSDGDSYCDTCNSEIKVVKPSEPEKDDKKDEECSCNCHAGGIKAFFFNLVNFFTKIFSKDARTCECGEAH